MPAGRTRAGTNMNSVTGGMLLIVSLCTGIRFAAADPETSIVWSGCGNSGNYTFRSRSAFGNNLNKVLDSLVKNVYATGFNTSSIVVQGKSSNTTVYGLVQCRGDLDSSDCKQCVSTARANLVKGCHNTSGFIQLDGCFLRYDDHNFYNDLDPTKDGQINHLCNPGNSSQPQEFTTAVKALLSNSTAEAQQSPKFFASDSVAVSSGLTANVYSLAQCWRDLSRTSCGSCLTYALENIFKCQVGALGAQFGSQNCYLRYEVYEFFDSSVIPTASVILPPAAAETPRGSSGISVSSGRSNTKVYGISLGVIVGGILGFIAAIVIVKRNGFCCRKRPEQYSRTRGPETAATHSGHKGESIFPLTISNSEFIFNYEILRESTSNFNESNKLGEGGFGAVFKGILPDGRQIAVKRLYHVSRQGDAEFLNEANLISHVRHKNLVKLLGCSIENSERLLVYEYLSSRSLDKILFDAAEHHLLDWKERYEIMVGTARGLTYLHEESEIPIIHRDIKASNILLDDKHRPRIADFGLAKFFGEDESHVSTNVAGTLGYMAPEYALHGQLTEKVDVFGFGVLVLEIISGRKSQSLVHDTEFLIEKTWRLYKAERALEVIDPALKGSYTWEDGIRAITVGLLCTQAAAALRPSMSQVVLMLTRERENLPTPTKPAFIDLDCVLGIHDQGKRPTIKEYPDTASSTAATSSTRPFGSADPSSSVMEPR